MSVPDDVERSRADLRAEWQRLFDASQLLRVAAAVAGKAHPEMDKLLSIDLQAQIDVDYAAALMAEVRRRSAG